MWAVTAAYYQNPQSDVRLTAVCPTLLCVSAEILHKAMVTILSLHFQDGRKKDVTQQRQLFGKKEDTKAL